MKAETLISNIQTILFALHKKTLLPTEGEDRETEELVLMRMTEGNTVHFFDYINSTSSGSFCHPYLRFQVVLVCSSASSL